SHEELARDLYRIGARHDVTVSPYLVERTELETLDPQFLESVVRDGVVLKGKPLAPSLRVLQLEPYQLVTLQLDRLNQREKVRLSRDLYGYSSERKYKRKRYRSHKIGFLERTGGRKLGRGTFLIPSDPGPSWKRSWRSEAASGGPSRSGSNLRSSSNHGRRGSRDNQPGERRPPAVAIQTVTDGRHSDVQHLGHGRSGVAGRHRRLPGS